MTAFLRACMVAAGLALAACATAPDQSQASDAEDDWVAKFFVDAATKAASIARWGYP